MGFVSPSSSNGWTASPREKNGRALREREGRERGQRRGGRQRGVGGTARQRGRIFPLFLSRELRTSSGVAIYHARNLACRSTLLHPRIYRPPFPPVTAECRTLGERIETAVIRGESLLSSGRRDFGESGAYGVFRHCLLSYLPSRGSRISMRRVRAERPPAGSV